MYYLKSLAKEASFPTLEFDYQQKMIPNIIDY